MPPADIQIKIDFEVYKQLTVRRATAQVTENDVLRDVLGLGALPTDGNGSQAQAAGIPWVTKGVTFPHGSDFRANYKGQSYTARVESGALVFRGKRYTSPSRAAMDVAQHNMNGWIFWECRLPGQLDWRLMDYHRPKQ